MSGSRRRHGASSCSISAWPVRNNEDIRLTSSGMIVGTPAYMAPEQAQGETVDHRADLYSLGCVLYQMVAGQLPFTGETAFRLLMSVVTENPVAAQPSQPQGPARAQRFDPALLAKLPGDRPASAREVITQLQGIEGGVRAYGSPLTAAAADPRSIPKKVLLVEPSRTQSGIIRKYLQDREFRNRSLRWPRVRNALHAVRSPNRRKRSSSPSTCRT